MAEKKKSVNIMDIVENIVVKGHGVNSWSPKAEDEGWRPMTGGRGDLLEDRESLAGAEDVESRPKIGRRGQPLRAVEPLPGAEDAESRPKTGRRGQQNLTWNSQKIRISIKMTGWNILFISPGYSLVSGHQSNPASPWLRVIEKLPESLAHLEEVHRRAKGLAREKFVLDEPTEKKRKRE